MSVVKMKKLSFGIHDASRKDLITRLQKAGCLHIESLNREELGEDLELKSIDVADDEISTQVSDLEDVIDFLSGYLPPVKLGLMDSLSATLPKISVSEMKKTYQSFQLVSVLKDIKTIEKRLRDAEVRRANLLKEKQDLQLWTSVGLDLDVVNGKNQTLGGMTGYVTVSDYEDFVNGVQEKSDLVEIFRAFAVGTDQYLYLIYHRSDEDKVQNAVKDLGFAPVTVSNRVGSVVANLDEIDDQISGFGHEIEVQKMFIVDYQDYLETLKIIHDYLQIEQTRFRAEENGLKTESVSFYTAWVPEPRLEDLQAVFSEYSDVDYSLSDPVEEEYENVPVELKVSKFAKAFEPITKMYGLPAYGKTLDPTAHLAPFYFLFYGFCLGDFMYGLVMLVVFGFLAAKSRKNPATHYFMKMLSLAGLSAMIFGLIFGSFFGDLFTNPDYLFIKPLTHVGLVNALKKPMVVLYIALILGAIQLMYGVFLNLLVQTRKSLVEALWNNVPWLVFLSGFFGWAVFFWIGEMAKVTLPPASVATILLYTAGVGIGLVVINAMRKGAKKGIGGFIGGFFGGLWDVYGATGYFSDLLSYARLLALGLSTSVIASVFNFLAFGMLMKGGSIVGIFFGIVLLLFGHAFNLVLNAFGAFVHSLRLQFVEFFSKFMEGGGKEFKPLKEEGLYYQMDKE